MPFYLYSHNCGFESLIRKAVDDRVLSKCPSCGVDEEIRPVINQRSCPNVMLSAVSNHYYNNGHGKYDPGLGKVIASREEHRQEMARQGVTEMNTDFDTFMAGQEPKDPEISMDDVKDSYEWAKAKVASGDIPPEKPHPAPDKEWKELS